MLGGFINAHAFWRAIFFVNIPLGIAVILLAITALRIKTLKAESSKFDLIGAFVMYVMIATFIFALNSITRLGLGNPVIIGCFATSFVALSVFLAREKSVSYPILDLSLFRNRNFTFANIAAAMALSVYMGVVFLLPFYLEIVRKIEVFHAGLLLMIPALMLVITSPISGRLSDKLGSRMLCSTGMALGAVAFVIISYFDTATPLPLIALGLLFAGLGVGFFLSPNNKLVMVSAPFDKQGVASGVYKILLNIGGAFGITVLPLVMIRSIMAKTGMQHVKLADLQGSPDILAFGFRGAFLFCALVCAASFVFSFLARDERAQ
jgi:MFS family permease